MTVIGFFDLIKRGNFKNVLINGAGSSIANMIMKYLRTKNISFISTVRRNELK